MGSRIGRLFVALALSLALTAPLAACGKKGPLEPPPAKEETKKKKAA